jgi:hypothetical protein
MLFKGLSLLCLVEFALISASAFAEANSSCSPKADPCFYAQIEILRQGKWCIEKPRGTVTFSCLVFGESASVSCPRGYRSITSTEQADIEAATRKIQIDKLNKQKKDCHRENNKEDESAAAVS